MTHIRPHKIFDLASEDTLGRMIHLKIPRRTENWLIETVLLIAAMKAVNARRIFEFGTFRGATTLNLAMNAPPGAEIFTFDLDPALKIEQDARHAEISRQHFEASKMEFDRIFHSIRQIQGDSHSFDARPYAPIDFVFVDGGHDLKTIKADTTNAFLMNPKCVAWHDYGNPDYPDVAKFLDAFRYRLFHVEESRLCFGFYDPRIGDRLES